MSFLIDLKLSSFRCYENESLSALKPGLVVLFGPNGAGKTNILEAVSFLSPGRGLRGAKVMEVQSTQFSSAWAVAGKIETDHGPVQLGTGLDPARENKRIIRIQGETVRAQSELGHYLRCIWLTPQMDRLFLDSAGERRRFLDRLIFTFDPGHSGRLTRYENAMRQRSKLLTEGKGDPSWLESLEAQMAETGCAIAAARLEFCQRLQQGIDMTHDTVFPKALISVNGHVEQLLEKARALEVEEMFAYQLSESRAKDAITGGAASGPHKSDLSVYYQDKNMPADQCSTGEQKALLIGLVLAHARLMAAEMGAPPLLLLDEVAAHLDENRRRHLYQILLNLGGQVWLTGTDRNLFEAIEGKAQFFEIHDGKILSPA